jgi:hypothetical protein
MWSAGLEKEADFLAACAREPARRAAGWADMWHYQGLGSYGSQLRDLYTRFDRDQVCLVRYRDLHDSPRATVEKVCAFLGVATGQVSTIPRDNVRAYVADSASNAVLRLLLRTGGRFGQHFPVPARRAVSGPLLALLHRSRQGYRTSAGPARPRLTPAQRARLVPAFEAEIRLLEEVTGDSYADWLSREHLTTVRPRSAPQPVSVPQNQSGRN